MKPANLARTSVRGGLTTLAGNLGGFFVRFAINMVLARLLLPEQFGEFGFALVYAELLGILAAFSFNSALIQLGDEHDDLLGTVVWFELGVGVLIFLVGLAVSPLVDAAHPDSPVIADCFILLAAARPFHQVSAAFMSALHRDFRYHWVAGLQFGAVTATSLGAIAWASVDPDPLALVVRDVGAQVVIALVLGVALARRHRRALIAFDRRSARVVARLGAALFLNRAIEILYSRVDQLVVGAALGERSLGYFVQARYLAMLPNALVAPMAGVVGLRTLSALGDDRVRRSRTFALVQFTMTRVLLVFAIGAVVAPDIAIRVVLGPNWAPAADILRVFGVWLVLLSLVGNYKVLLIARFDWFWLNAGNVAALAVVAALAWPGALLADAAGVAVVAAAATAASLAIYRHRATAHVDLPPTIYLPGVLAATIAAAAGLATAALPLHDVWAWLPSTLGLAVAAAAFAAATWLIEGANVRAEARYILAKLALRRRPAPEAAPPDDAPM